MFEYMIVFILNRLRRFAPDSVSSKVVKFYRIKTAQVITTL